MYKKAAAPEEKQGFFGKIASKLGLGGKKTEKAKLMRKRDDSDDSDEDFEENICKSAAPRMM